jgi:uncharacterized delta-60 repeat protein/RHS repeat-associated protein
VTTGGGNGVNSNDLLKQVRYPDKTTGAASTSAANDETFTYDALGERKTLADRNGSTHTYSYDVLGRLLTDSVTTLGSGVDGTVRRLDYNYDTAGRSNQMTSYGNTAGTGTPLNQVQNTYNGYGQLTTQYQEHGGAVNTATSAKVQYAYSEGGTDITNLTDDNSRLTKIVYPNGRVLRYEYGVTDSLSNRISRLAFLAGDANGAASTHIEEYSYLGLSTVVIRNRPSANSKLTYVKQSGESNGDAGDQYTGLDRFGRIVDQRWVGQSGSSATTLDRFQYGYDANSNPLYKNNLGPGTSAAAFSELYHTNGTSGASTSYDGLNRLTDFRRGTLSDVNSDGAYDTVSTLNTLAGSSKNWSLDAVGNWNSTTTGTNSAVVRTHDKQNEVTAVGGNSLTFDNNGNTTTDESGHVLTYDAWNRLATYGETYIDECCGSGVNTLESHYYDALGRRITTTGGGAFGISQQLLYSDQGQVLEEKSFCSDGSPVSQSQSQYVWSPTYVDELIERDRDADGTADGALDTSFDTDGKVTTDFGSGDEAHGVVVQGDGQTVVVGRSGNDIAVARYNRDGSPDSSFDSDGKVTTDVGGANDTGEAVALQSDGRIVVVGSSGGTALGLVRYNSDGSPDNSFDSDGKVTTTILSGVSESGQSVAIQSDGKIIVGGYAYDSGTGLFKAFVARYNADGSLDGSFGSSGVKLITDAGGNGYYGMAIAIQSDGNIVLGMSDAGGNLAVARLMATDGALDTSFDTDGIALADFSTYTNVEVSGLALQADGKIVVSGRMTDATLGTYAVFALARFTDTGGLDPFFDTDGKVATTFATGATSASNALRVQADGKIVVAGYSNNNFAMARYNANGSLDTTFDTDGKLTTDLGGVDAANALWIGPDYRVTVVGRKTTDFGVIRYKVTSSLEERLYAQTDANHNVTSVADVFGAVKERFVYDPYGAATVLTPAWGATSDAYDWVITSQGGRLDSLAGLIRHGMRDQSVSLGRWVQQDPIGYPDGANRYEADLSNPTGFVDPLGLKGKTYIPTDPKIPKTNRGPNNLRPDSPVFAAMKQWATSEGQAFVPPVFPDFGNCKDGTDATESWVDITSYRVVGETDLYKGDKQKESPDRYEALALEFEYERQADLLKKQNDKFYIVPKKIIPGSKKIHFVHFIAKGTLYWKCGGTIYAQDFDTETDNINGPWKGTGAHFPDETAAYYEALQELEAAYNQFLTDNGANPVGTPRVGEYKPPEKPNDPPIIAPVGIRHPIVRKP